MASIQKRGKSFSVVYYHSGEQKWETFSTEKEAKARKVEIEYEQSKGMFVPPAHFSMNDLLDKFIESYGVLKWGHSSYKSNISLLNNYVRPYIGNQLVKNCTSQRMTAFFAKLGETYAVQLPGRKSPPKLISDRNISDVYQLLKIAFELAIEWGELGKSPLSKKMKPKSTRGTRETWDEETAKLAISLCESKRLLIYFHLALGCSMRIGEISGLQKSCLFLDDMNDFQNAYLKIETQLTRIDKDAYESLKRKKEQIKLVFPEMYPSKQNKTVLVLKTPKTNSSIRTVYIPPTTAKLLQQWLIAQEEQKRLIGNEYQDHGLVMALDNGRPIDARLIGSELNKFIQRHKLKDVDFHSLRHTSTSVKLVITKGDIKSVQGDNGHNQAKMVTDTYAEIDDRRRQKNAKMFDKQFFLGENSNEPSESELENLVLSLMQIPNMREKILSIIAKSAV